MLDGNCILQVLPAYTKIQAPGSTIGKIGSPSQVSLTLRHGSPGRVLQSIGPTVHSPVMSIGMYPPPNMVCTILVSFVKPLFTTT